MVNGEEKGSEEDLYSYVAKKLNEYLEEGEKVTASIIERELNEGSMPLKHYLLMCKIFKVNPNLELHSRIYSSSIRYPRLKVSDADFPTPPVYKDRRGKKTTIEEREDGFFVVTENDRLHAEKWRTKYGGSWWGLTVIDYETEKGVYTVVKEAGELSPPHVRAWYTQIASRTSIGFKTAQPLKSLVQILLDNTNSSFKTLSKITGVNTSVLRELGMKRGTKERKSINLGDLLTLIALKSMFEQTDILREIKQFEEEIDTIDRRKIPEIRRQDVLYINIRTSFGASLIGHLVCFGQLNRLGESIIFEYANSELECVEDVSRLLKFYGYPGNIRHRDGKKGEKDKYYVVAEGFLAYALWCAIPRAEGNIIVNNPEVPSWITDDPYLAAPFLRAIILDKAYIDPISGEMTISFEVDVTEELDEKGLGQPIRDIVDKRLKGLREKREL